MSLPSIFRGRSSRRQLGKGAAALALGGLAATAASTPDVGASAAYCGNTCYSGNCYNTGIYISNWCSYCTGSCCYGYNHYTAYESDCCDYNWRNCQYNGEYIVKDGCCY